MSKNKHFLTPDWPAPANVHAATTLRTGGVSSGVYASLNPAEHVQDDPESVLENRRLLKTMLNLPAEPVWLEQIHSNIAVNAATVQGVPQADAAYTIKPGVVCTVMTADCLPLLVCDSLGAQVAAIHAGWRGLLAGVITNTINAMQPADFLVWLGPAIGPQCFEVGAEVRQAFVNKSADFSNAFSLQTNDKWLADIYRLARIELAALGIGNVYGGNLCTVTEPGRFYSYRRDQQTGRMATLIWRD
ncbi:MAG: peptidoglycan editing factor PgeF [Methylococcales bacterium]